MSGGTIAILSPGDMGHAVGRILADNGHGVITCLRGRSDRTRALAATGAFRDVESLDAVVKEADLVVSILPPASAVANAEAVAAAMGRTGATPPYVDCNAISPATTLGIGDIIGGAGALYIDGGIIGTKPGPDYRPRLYVSGPDTSPAMVLDATAFQVVPIGQDIGRGSAIKMCYAGLTKGTWTLHTAVLLAAEAHGLSAELRDELLLSQKNAHALMERMVPRLPADSERWIGEMEEIAATFDDVGVTPGFHEGAADIFRLLAKTPFAAETRETFDTERSLEESVRVYAQHLTSAKG
jgi:3-hydroxyisobutyrate dehydrogenase-like beta-hydroxyacid dehydrogenase